MTIATLRAGGIDLNPSRRPMPGHGLGPASHARTPRRCRMPRAVPSDSATRSSRTSAGPSLSSHEATSRSKSFIAVMPAALLDGVRSAASMVARIDRIA